MFLLVANFGGQAVQWDRSLVAKLLGLNHTVNVLSNQNYELKDSKRAALIHCKYKNDSLLDKTYIPGCSCIAHRGMYTVGIMGCNTYLPWFTCKLAAGNSQAQGM